MGGVFLSGPTEEALGRVLEILSKAPPWLFIALLTAALAYLRVAELDTTDAAAGRWWLAFVVSVFSGASLLAQLGQFLVVRHRRTKSDRRTELTMMSFDASRLAEAVRVSATGRRRGSGSLIVNRDLCHKLTAFYSRLQSHGVPTPELDYHSKSFEQETHYDFLTGMKAHLPHAAHKDLVAVALASGGVQPEKRSGRRALWRRRA